MTGIIVVPVILAAVVVAAELGRGRRGPGIHSDAGWFAGGGS
ncbi:MULTISPECIES: hypothetical protein [unclassified Pseudonocardia]|jgi:hypothetical protein|nr:MULTISPECIES: hypothetical protein [unclassified Pseudonocardia]